MSKYGRIRPINLARMRFFYVWTFCTFAGELKLDFGFKITSITNV